MTPRPPPPLAAAPALTFGSLFAGIGGFDLGFKRAGMNDCWQIEIDENCRDLLRRRFPTCEKFADIREVDVSTLAPVDVICGGFPCQDLSVAGKRAGLSGARSGLFYELVRIVAELRPRFVVWENVPGLLSSDKGRDFARVLHALAGIGYHGVWRLLDAQHFGVAQSRRKALRRVRSRRFWSRRRSRNTFSRARLARASCAAPKSAGRRCRHPWQLLCAWWPTHNRPRRPRCLHPLHHRSPESRRTSRRF